jgi:hypothetical protein
MDCKFSPNAVRLVAAVATIVLASVVLAIASRGSGKHLANHKKVSPLKALLVEKATSTYSLSRLQLYIWLFAAVAAYLYFLAAKVLGQDVWKLVDIPPGLIGITFISVSTNVVATGVTSLTGGKGSGEFDPTPSNLISSGGDIAPERVQQLIWTLIAAPAVVVFAYVLDPCTLSDTDFDSVPNNFLALMGLSSGGYIAGKIARGPGPKITDLSAIFLAGPPPFITLSIRGTDIQTKDATYSIRDLTVPDSAEITFPASILPSSKIDSSGVATSLDLQAPAAGLRVPSSGTKWGYNFTILATDGEKAEWEF